MNIKKLCWSCITLWSGSVIKAGCCLTCWYCIEHQEALLLEGFFSEGDSVFEGGELGTISTKKLVHNTN